MTFPHFRSDGCNDILLITGPGECPETLAGWQVTASDFRRDWLIDETHEISPADVVELTRRIDEQGSI